MSEREAGIALIIAVAESSGGRLPTGAEAQQILADRGIHRRRSAVYNWIKQAALTIDPPAYDIDVHSFTDQFNEHLTGVMRICRALYAKPPDMVNVADVVRAGEWWARLVRLDERLKAEQEESTHESRDDMLTYRDGLYGMETPDADEEAADSRARQDA